MLKTIINFSNWFGLLNKTIVSFIRILILSKSTKSYKKQRVGSNRIVLLGNGPSFKNSIDENLKFFQNSELICLNHFAITEYYMVLKPKYYFVIAHDLFLDDTLDDYKNASIKLFNAIAEKTKWPLKFFITYEAKSEMRWQQILSQNKYIEIVFMNITPVEGFRCLRYHWYKKGLGMARPHNVMIPSLFFSINNGAKEVIIIGAEHSWLQELHVDENNTTLFFNKHFYDTQYNAKKCNYKGTSFMKLHEVIRSFSYAFESYHELNEYANSKNVKIYNCTPTSFIDAFERKKITDFIS
ncbi:MAG: hypothetical protein JXR36_16605 [Bacteroidales bacterium]|nr:hypothetical protein [Bacteroidales bacterium]